MSVSRGELHAARRKGGSRTTLHLEQWSAGLVGGEPPAPGPALGVTLSPLTQIFHAGWREDPQPRSLAPSRAQPEALPSPNF